MKTCLDRGGNEVTEVNAERVLWMQQQVKTANNMSRWTFIAAGVLAVALCVLIYVLGGWNMIRNVVTAMAIVNLGFSLYYTYKAEQLTKRLAKLDNTCFET